MSEALVLVVLLWAVLLIPSALRSRKNRSPHVTVGGFERAMEVLKSSPPASRPPSRGDGRQLLVPGDAGRIVEPADPAARSRSAEITDRIPFLASLTRPSTRSSTHEDPVLVARRMWFFRLVGGTAASLLLAILVGGVLLWVVALVAAASTGAYVALLRRWKLQRDQVRDVVRELEVPAADDGVPEDLAAGGERDGVAFRLRRWNG